jgi:hypothetical protein
MTLIRVHSFTNMLQRRPGAQLLCLFCILTLYKIVASVQSCAAGGALVRANIVMTHAEIYYGSVFLEDNRLLLLLL